jgi:hypothetical protein
MNIMKKVFFLFAVMLSIAFSASQASGATANVTVNGTTYTLSTQYLPYTGNEGLFQSQPWWGNASLANAISNQLKYQLGTLDGSPIGGSIPSALVAYGISSSYVSITYWDGDSVIDCPDCPDQGGTYYYVTGSATKGIPTLAEWALIMLSSLLALGAVIVLRRQRQ